MSKWWKHGIIYQIYPRSYQDAIGPGAAGADGVGDLPGIQQRLDYLAWLGIDAIWISPIYPSPMADFGYDVSDYVDIHPMFGTLADMDALIAAAHERDIRVILDLVPSHTSEAHPWFQESRSARDNPKREWYMWEDPAPGGGPPTNWLSRFDGKSGWEWDPATEQYYFHSFLKEQPDLNWRNPAVREAMFDVMRFWFDRGVDGFRVDVAYRVMKDPQLRDNPPNPKWEPGMDPSARLIETYHKNISDSHRFNRWIREIADEYDERVLIGEINLPLEKLVKHYGAGDEFHLPQNINLHDTPWEASAIRALADRYESLLPGGAWPNWVLGNHDQHRVASRIGAAQARVALMLLLTLRGTPINYYGDEIGMHDVEIPPDRVQDPWEINVPGLGLGRDPERTPMQWTPGPNAGFCPPDVEPWLPIADDYKKNNVEVERDDPTSVLRLVRSLIQLRRQSPALHGGSYRSLHASEGLFVYLRQAEEQAFLVVLNFTPEPQEWAIPEAVGKVRLRLSTHGAEAPRSVGRLALRANEGALYEVTS